MVVMGKKKSVTPAIIFITRLSLSMTRLSLWATRLNDCSQKDASQPFDLPLRHVSSGVDNCCRIKNLPG
jgi:hypothetical protein